MPPNLPDHVAKSWLKSAGWGLAILSFVNLFNYLDRYLVPALFETLKHSELALSDAELGLLMSGFLAVYTLAAPVFGALGDRRARPRLIAFGVGCWSLATMLSGLAGSFIALFAARASVGIGEAAYGTIAPSLLSDYFPADKRGRVMAIFSCAIPVGSALGYVVGGLMDVHFGWRAAFFAAGAPGLALAVLCWWLRDPPRGAQDAVPPPESAPAGGGQNAGGSQAHEYRGGAVDAGHSPESAPARGGRENARASQANRPAAASESTREAAGARSPQAGRAGGTRDAGNAPRSAPARGAGLGSEIRATYRRLLTNRPYLATVLGYAAYTFAMGGLASWMPAFLERVRGMPRAQATVSFGYIVVVTGLVGTFIGGWLGDYCRKRLKCGYLLVSAIATLVAAPFVWFALTVASTTAYLVCMVIAQLLMFLSTGPINATIVNLVLPTQRASAVALSVFAIHLLGDAISPYLIGRVSDASSLTEAVKIVPVAVVVSGLLWGWAAREQALADI
jgi:MFS family permease